MLFFEAELLGMDELPHRAVIDLQPARGEFGNQSAQGEVSILDPLQQPDTVFAANCLRLVPAHLARRNIARLAQTPYPTDGRADPNPKLFGGLIAGQPASLNRRNHSLPKV
jgi:hypothetical protein